MGQCESKARDFKEQKRRKTLEVRFYPLFLPIIASTLSTTKLEIRAK
jgi:hypothetical protein